MGLDTRCSATFNKQTSVGRVQLETDYVLFRGDFRVKLVRAAITGVTAKGGVLSLKSAEGTLALSLGPAADTWAAKIRSPKSRVEKLGVKLGARMTVVGVVDVTFLDELRAAGADVSTRARQGSDQIYVAIESAKDLARFETLLPSLAPDGAMWAIRRRGLADASEAATMAAGKAAGLVDVKVARFSETHTAEKFVRPVAARRPVSMITPASAKATAGPPKLREGGKVTKTITMARRHEGAKTRTKITKSKAKPQALG